mgnify:CR=1 FL=1
MAKLIAKSTNPIGSNLSWPLANQPTEPGSYPGVIVDILEAKEIEKNWNDETKIVDIARFLIAYRNDDDDVCLAQTNEMTISAFSKSNLIKFISGLRGEMPPMDGSYDFLEELGTNCMVTIEKKTSKKGTTYGLASSLSPITKRLAKECPDIEDVEIPGGSKYPGLEDDQEVEKMDKPGKSLTNQDEDSDNPF